MDPSHINQLHRPIYPLPTEGELIDFPHGAAGHEGISSNANGDLIIKPCTQAEIDFYEATKDHPDFQAHIPVYIGKLELGVQGDALKHLSSADQENIISSKHASTETANTNTLQVPQQTPREKKRDSKVWIPSGGKKLNTGLAVVLENAAASFKKPNVIDLKLGSRLWADDAPQAKRTKLDQVSANTTSSSLGFRVAGAKVWLGDPPDKREVEPNTEIKDGYKSFNKLYGQSLDENSVKSSIARFLSGTVRPVAQGKDQSLLGSVEARIVTKRLIHEVEMIQHVLENQESRMYSASILIVIEGDHQALQEAMHEEKRLQEDELARRGSVTNNDCTTEEENHNDGDEDGGDEDEDDDDDSVLGPRVMEVRIIDFAHAQFTPGLGPDENVLKGVRSILRILREICE